MCRPASARRCRYFTFNGYFGFGPDAQKIYDLYPYGGFCEFMTAPQYALVKLPDNVTFEQAARFGYLGTSYGAMKKANAVAGQSMLVDGISGTLGLGAALLGLAMGITRILRDRPQSRTSRARQGAGAGPHRGARARTMARPPMGQGAHRRRRRRLHDQRLGPGRPGEHHGRRSAGGRRGGRAVNVGAVAEPFPLDIHWLMDEQIQLIGSTWFTAAQGQDMAELARAGLLDLSVFEHQRFPLEEINHAISGLQTATADSATTSSCPDRLRAWNFEKSDAGKMIGRRRLKAALSEHRAVGGDRYRRRAVRGTQ